MWKHFTRTSWEDGYGEREDRVAGLKRGQHPLLWLLSVLKNLIREAVCISAEVTGDQGTCVVSKNC